MTEQEPTFADSMAKYYPELVFTEFNPKDFEKHWGPLNEQAERINMLLMLTEQAYNKFMREVSEELAVEMKDLKIRRNVEGELILIYKDTATAGTITTDMVWDEKNFTNTVVITFHPKP